jgi:hypothetical protein
MTISQIILLSAVLGFIAGIMLVSLLNHEYRRNSQTTINVQAHMIDDLLKQQREHAELHATFEKAAASERAMDRHLSVYGWVDPPSSTGHGLPCVCVPGQGHSNGCPEYVAPVTNIPGYVGLQADEL